MILARLNSKYGTHKILVRDCVEGHECIPGKTGTNRREF